MKYEIKKIKKSRYQKSGAHEWAWWVWGYLCKFLSGVRVSRSGGNWLALTASLYGNTQTSGNGLTTEQEDHAASKNSNSLLSLSLFHSHDFSQALFFISNILFLLFSICSFGCTETRNKMYVPADLCNDD